MSISYVHPDRTAPVSYVHPNRTTKTSSAPVQLKRGDVYNLTTGKLVSGK